MTCDSAGLPHTKLALSVCDSESDRATTSKLELEKWAALIASTVAPMPHVPPIVPAIRAMPEAWRTDVEALTPDAGQSDGTLLARETAELSARAGSTSGDESELNRVQVRLNAGELGELSLVVERSVSGLRIQIGAENGGVLSSLVRNSDAMAQALSNIGQPVTSLTFITMDGVGINLAPSRMVPGNKARTDETKSSDDPSRAHARRKGRRINVLG